LKRQPNSHMGGAQGAKLYYSRSLGTMWDITSLRSNYHLEPTFVIGSHPVIFPLNWPPVYPHPYGTEHSKKVRLACPGFGASHPHLPAAVCYLGKRPVISLRSLLFLMLLQVSKVSPSSKMESPLSFVPLTTWPQEGLGTEGKELVVRKIIVFYDQFRN
jgi:hypothetical protein